MKKLLSLVLALIMTLTLCASALAYDGDMITITADSDGDYPFTWDPANDKIAAFIEDQFGITFKQSDIHYYINDFVQTQQSAVDGTLPNVFAADILYYTQEITQFIPEEFVREIPAEMLEKYPLTKALVENDAVEQLVASMYGGYYFLPKPDSADPSIYLAERKGIFIRTDWLENLGLEMPTSWEELYEVAHAFTYDDPDGNGVNDTYGLTGDGMGTLRYFFASIGAANRYWNRDAEGNWYFGALDDRNVEVLEWMRKMYEDGSIDPDFGAATYQTGLQKFSSNQFGMCVRNADADWIHQVLENYYGAANPGVNAAEVVGVIPSLGVNKGDPQIMDGYTSCMVATMFSPETTDEQLDRFLAYYEYLLSDEGRLMRMGLEGEDWVKNADGSISLIRDENGHASVLSDKYPCIDVTHWPSWGFELQADVNVEYYDNYNDEAKAINAAACAIRNQNIVKPEVGPMLIEDDVVLDAVAFSFAAEYWQIVTGTKPVAEMFAEMKERAMSLYFNDAIEVVNEYAEKYGW